MRVHPCGTLSISCISHLSDLVRLELGRMSETESRLQQGVHGFLAISESQVIAAPDSPEKLVLIVILGKTCCRLHAVSWSIRQSLSSREQVRKLFTWYTRMSLIPKATGCIMEDSAAQRFQPVSHVQILNLVIMNWYRLAGPLMALMVAT